MSNHHPDDEARVHALRMSDLGQRFWERGIFSDRAALSDAILALLTQTRTEMGSASFANVLKQLDEANAARLRCERDYNDACEVLGDEPMTKTLSLSGHIAQVKNQRDALLASCKTALRYHDGDSLPSWEAESALRSAIAKAEGRPS